MEEKALRLLTQKRKLLLKRAADIEDFLRGSVVLMKRRCAYPGCRKCASGERHPTWVLTFNQKGKTHTVYLGKSKRAEAHRLVENYRRAQALLEEIAQINMVLFRRKDPSEKGPQHGARGQGP